MLYDLFLEMEEKDEENNNSFFSGAFLNAFLHS